MRDPDGRPRAIPAAGAAALEALGWRREPAARKTTRARAGTRRSTSRTRKE